MKINDNIINLIFIIVTKDKEIENILLIILILLKELILISLILIELCAKLPNKFEDLRFVKFF